MAISEVKENISNDTNNSQNCFRGKVKSYHGMISKTLSLNVPANKSKCDKN